MNLERFFATDAEWMAYEQGVVDGLAGYEEAVNEAVGHLQDQVAIVKEGVRGSTLDLCRVEGCRIRQLFDGYCAVHDRRLRLAGDIDAAHVDVGPGVCAFPDCGKRMSTRHLCKTHYNYWRELCGQGKGGEYVENIYQGIHTPVIIRREAKEGERMCDFTQCDRRHLAKGMCRTHYTSFQQKRSRHSAEYADAWRLERIAAPHETDAAQ